MKNHIHCILLFGLICAGCKKLVTLDAPANQLSPAEVYNDSTSVVAATAGLYTQLVTVDVNFIKSVGTYTDELQTSATTGTAPEFTNGALSATNLTSLAVWQNLYTTIYKSNALVLGLENAPGLSKTLRNQCIGEAKFIRAYCYYMLINIYGDVPLTLTTDVNLNALANRAPYNSVLTNVITDLKEAMSTLSATYPFTGEKVHANKWAAAALLSKAYLLNADYTNAELLASVVINTGTYALVSNLNNVFVINSPEAILQLWNATGSTSLNAVPASGVPPYQPTAAFLSAFEPGDQRKINWLKTTVVSSVTYYYPYKYKQRLAITGATAEYSMYLRLADLYLVRAEARAMLGNPLGASLDLNVVRTRAGLPNTNAITQADLLTAILHERQVELFYEGGNRFFDLKRSGKIDAIVSAIKPLWRPTAKLYPIPQSEILSNPNLAQNPGY